MKVQAYNPITNSYLNGTGDIQVSDSETAQSGSPVIRTQDKKIAGNNGKNIITQTERDFFIKMFPESSEQLSNHILFNRNGRIQNYALAKGTIVDGRV